MSRRIVSDATYGGSAPHTGRTAEEGTRSSAHRFHNLRGRMLRILWITFRILGSYLTLSLASRFVSRTTQKRWVEQLHHKNASLFLNTALSLKGLMIKVGQFMSARVDLLPVAYTQTLSRLQDEVPPAPFAEIQNVITGELGVPLDTLFRSFHEIPLASASLGQVHEAVLKTPFEDGTTDVAVKVQYPDIERIVETDLRAIALVIRILQRIFTHIHFDTLSREFSKLVHRELDYLAEAKNAERFYRQFSGDDRFVIPRVVWRHTTKRVLTLTRIHGIKINQCDALSAAGISPRAVAQLLVESYMKQILVHRFFHGDPHPGNLFVQPLERGKLKLVFVDFGLMQEIDAKTDEGMRGMILAIINRDIPAIARALIALGFITDRGGREQMRDIESVVQFFMDRYRDISPHTFRQITITDIAQDMNTLFTLYPSLQVPHLFILAGRAVGMLNGLCAQLDPDINMIELAKPYAKKYAAPADSYGEILQKGKEVIKALLSLPDALQTFLERGQTSGVETHMHSETLERALLKIYRLALRTLWGGIATGALVFIRLTPDFHFMSLEGAVMGALLGVSITALAASFLSR